MSFFFLLYSSNIQMVNGFLSSYRKIISEFELMIAQMMGENT